MKKLLIFVFGLAIGAIVCGLYFSYSLEPFLEGQTKRELATRIDWGLVYKNQLESNELDKLTKTLNSSLKHQTELLLAMDKIQGGTQEPYLKSVIKRVSEAGIELSSAEIDELAKKFNQSKQ